MPDLALRVNKDMLVLSGSVIPLLEAQGVDASDLEMTYVIEPETIHDAQRLELSSGAQVMVLDTAAFTPARLAHRNMREKLPDLARIAFEIAAEFKPQHIVVELGPTGLPLDPDSKASLVEHRDQFARAVEAFEPFAPDAYFLNGFTDITELKCALMGVAKKSDRLVMASVNVLPDGTLAGGRGTVEEAAAVMGELGACVAGFATDASPAKAVAIAKRMGQATHCALMAQLAVKTRDKRQWEPTEENPYHVPNTFIDAALALRAAGVQFLRAAGNAAPAYTGALVAATTGLDVSYLAAAQVAQAQQESE